MNRPTSSLQLMSKFSKFQDTRRDDKEALQYASTEPLPSVRKITL